MATSKKTIKPEVLGGFKDMLPREALILQKIVDTVKIVYQSFGFLPLETPTMESLDVLTGGEETEKSIFVARILRGAEDKGVADAEWADNFALRFDLTVSLARVIAAYPDLPKPFKRYQLGRVFRGEKPQAGRFREFFQLDFDTIGADTINADIETIVVMYECLKALGINNFTVRFNTRKVLNGLAEVVGLQSKAKELLRIIDKLDKIKEAGVKAELMRQPDNEFDESALAMSETDAERILGFLRIKNDDPQQILAQLDEYFAGNNGECLEGVAELRNITKTLDALAIPRRNWKIDLSVARGLDYYTGPVFEAVLDDMPEIGSVFAGGRYDGLTNRFMPDSNIAGVGASIGVDRLIVAMQKLGLIEAKESLTEVLVTIFDPKFEGESMALAAELRQAGFTTELYLGNDRTMRAQFAYAAKKGILFAVIIGETESRDGVVALKDLTMRQQVVLTKDALFARLKEMKS